MRYLRIYVEDIKDTLVIYIPESKISALDFATPFGEWNVCAEVPGEIGANYYRCDPRFYDNPFEGPLEGKE